MPRPMQRKGRAKRGQCPACRRTFAPNTEVLVTRSGSVVCETHADMFVADAILDRGPWSRLRRS